MNEHCPVNEEQINSLVDGRLSARVQRRVAAHVANCEQCSALAGQVLACKRFLGARAQDAELPAQAWPHLLAALDQVDATRRAADARRPGWNLGAAPLLATCGLLLILVAGIWRGQALVPSGIGPTLVRHHLAAETTFSRMAGDAERTYDVVTVRPGKATWEPIARRIFSHAGHYVDHTLYRVDDRGKISEFMLPAEVFATRGFEPVTVQGQEYLVRAERGGSVVAWVELGVARVLVARTDAAALVALAASHKADAVTGPVL